MNSKKIISIFISLNMLLSQTVALADETGKISSEAEKHIIAEEKFENGFDGWDKKDNFYVIGNKLILNNYSNLYESSIISKGLSVDNGELEFDMNIKKGDYFAVIFRAADDKSFYCMRFYAGSNKVLLLKKVKGGAYVTVKQTRAELEYSTDYRVGISLIGKQISVRINGNKLFTTEDKSLKVGAVGFSGKNVEAMVDNIEIFTYSDVNYEEFVEKEESNINATKIVYVSPTGNDSDGDGTNEKPYRTIEAAKKAANRLKNSKTPVDVIFKGGEYPVTETITFSANDSGTKDAPVRYMAAEGEKVVFTGAKTLDVSKIKPIDNSIKERLYEHVRDKVVAIDLKEQGIPENIAKFTKYANENSWVGVTLKPPVITLNDTQQTIARWPNSGYNTVISCEKGGAATSGDSLNNGGIIYYSETNPSRWSKAEDLFIEGFLGNYWLGEWAKVDSVDTEKNAINMKYRTQFGIATKHRWSAINLLEEIDIPGEWYIDSDSMIMYYYPPHTLTAEDKLEFAVLNKNMLNLSGVENIAFEGIEFTKTASNPAVTFDNASDGNGININNGSKNITLKNCIISHTGMHGIYISATDVLIDGCILYDIGFNAINCRNCGDREKLIPSNVVIQNCDISDVCRDTNSNNYAAVFMQPATVGVTVKNNIIHNCENNAVRYAGNGHLIANNEIYNAVIQTADAGAIYSGRSWVEYGTVVEYNFFHDIGQKTNIGDYPASSIFWDDYESGQEFSHNISVIKNYTKTSAVKIGGGIDNVVKGNTMVASASDIIGEDRSTGSIRDWDAYAADTLKLSTVPYTSTEWTLKYPQSGTILSRMEENGGVLKLENTITDNLTVDCSATSIAKTIIEASEYERNVNVVDDYSIFVDPDKLDYRVKKEAKEKYGISDEVLDEDYDLNQIGIISDYNPDKSLLEVRATYPENGIKDIETKNIVLAWTKAPIADTYRYVVATDSEFKNIVVDDVTEYRSVKIEGLKNAQTYYWKVLAQTNSRRYGQEVLMSNDTMSFTTAVTDTLDKTILYERIERAYDVLSEIKEGDKVGEYKAGTIKAVNEKIADAEAVTGIETGTQSDVDKAAFALNEFINGIDYYRNIGYTTLNIKGTSDWTSGNEHTKLTPSNGMLKIDIAGSSEITLGDILSNYNIMCFKTRVESLEDTWVGYGLRATDRITPIWAQDAYYLVVKRDIIELQKHGRIYEIAENNGRFKEGEWNDMQFGAITTPNGVHMMLKVNGELIFDYLDKTEPNYKPGMFTMFNGKQGNVIEVADADYVPESLYVMSDKIVKEINKKEEDGNTVNTSDSMYVETGKWRDSPALRGDSGDGVRTTSEAGASAKWIMETGNSGNGKLYKVSYYHIPEAEGDKNVNVYVTGYAGGYETTIDLSSGEEGYVDIGYFTFMDADYIGRCSVIFTGSGTGNLNVSNVKFELVEDGEHSNMLK